MAIIEASDYCEQGIKFKCFLAPLKYTNKTKYFWMDQNNMKRVFLQSDPDIEYNSLQIEDYHQCACSK